MLRKLLSFICCILFLTLLNTAGAAGRGTILFVPLDNRPVCLEYSVNSMQAAGWNVETPPEEYIASNHRSGNPDKLYEWLAERAPLANAVIVSSDAMLYGGLVDSRTHHIDREVLKRTCRTPCKLKRPWRRPAGLCFYNHYAFAACQCCTGGTSLLCRMGQPHFSAWRA